VKAVSQGDLLYCTVDTVANLIQWGRGDTLFDRG
jgi:hypothetical protein